MESLTRRQRDVLAGIRRVLVRDGAPPTTRELARMMNLDVKSVAQHLDRLERKGYITRRPRESRNIRLVERGDSAGTGRAVSPKRRKGARRASGRGAPMGARPPGQPGRGVPLVGGIAAGRPMLAEENLEDYVRMEDFFGPEGGFFLLRVRGDSMEGAGIRDGDLVAVGLDGEGGGGGVRNGDIAVVLVDGEATVKRLFRRGRFLRLEPENPAYETRVVDAGRSAVRIVGPVKGLIRRIG